MQNNEFLIRNKSQKSDFEQKIAKLNKELSLLTTKTTFKTPKKDQNLSEKLLKS